MLGELGELRERAREQARAVESHVAELLEMARQMEKLTSGTPEWYFGMRAGTPGEAAREDAGGDGRGDEGEPEEGREASPRTLTLILTYRLPPKGATPTP